MCRARCWARPRHAWVCAFTFTFAIAAPSPARADDAGAVPPPVTVESGRTTTIEISPVLGTSVERAFASEAYAQAGAADRDERWSEAAGLYHQAIVEWSSRYRHQPSPELERAIAKAERERQRSQLLAGVQAQRDKLPPGPLRGLAVERGRISRLKLMSVRAYTGTVPADLLAHTR